MATRGLLPSSSGHDRSHEPHRRSQAPRALELRPDARRRRGRAGAVLRHPSGVLPRRLRRAGAARGIRDPDLRGSGARDAGRGRGRLGGDARPAPAPGPPVAADRARAPRGRGRGRSREHVVLATRGRLDRPGNRGGRDLLGDPARSSGAPLGGRSRRGGHARPARFPPRPPVLQGNRDRRRVGRRARARRGRRHRSGVPRPRRGRHRRPRLRPRRDGRSRPRLRARDRHPAARPLGARAASRRDACGGAHRHRRPLRDRPRRRRGAVDARAKAT